MTLVAPLRRRPFRLLFTGQVVSDLGDWLDYVALVVLIVYAWHHGPGALAALSICLAAPWALVAPIAGVWADRLPRKRLMIACDLLRAGVVTGLVFAPNLWVLLALATAKMSVSTFFVPAQQSSIRLLVADEDLLAATSLSQFSLQLTKVVGPALGGLVIAAFGVREAFVADAASFALSALVLSRLPTLQTRATEAAAQERDFRRELLDGFRTIGADRLLGIAIASMGAAVFLVFTFDALSPLALRSLGMRPSMLGLAIGGIGLGAAVGTVAAGQFGGRANPFTLLGAGKVAAGVAVTLVGIGAATGTTLPDVVWLPVLVLIGLGAASILVPYGYLLQSRTPPEVLGRVVVSADALQTMLALGAPPLGAAIALSIGVGPLFAIAGSALAVLGLAVLATRPRADGAGGLDAAATADVVAHGFEVVPEQPPQRAGLAPAARYAQPL